jgi:hypothetical protein
LTEFTFHVARRTPIAFHRERDPCQLSPIGDRSTKTVLL